MQTVGSKDRHPRLKNLSFKTYKFMLNIINVSSSQMGQVSHCTESLALACSEPGASCIYAGVKCFSFYYTSFNNLLGAYEGYRLAVLSFPQYTFKTVTLQVPPYTPETP